MALAIASPSLVRAQGGEVVQPTPPAAAVETLNQSLARLSRDPRDVAALLGAGQAALDLGDVQAANGFYTRANMVDPNSGKARLGLAVVELMLKQPVEAAANFDAAESLGEPARDHLMERALAYDLTGQQEKAQRDYQAVLRANPSDDVSRVRYAVSLGISGQLAAAEKELAPAINRSDREAWRMRAFILAMNGRLNDAHQIAQTVMPKGLADALDPYLMRMSLLTPAQKAAAVHLGDFPSTVLRQPVPSQTLPVQVAVAEPQPAKSRRDRDRDRRRRDRDQAPEVPVQVARAAATPPPIALGTAPRAPAGSASMVPPQTISTYVGTTSSATRPTAGPPAAGASASTFTPTPTSTPPPAVVTRPAPMPERITPPEPAPTLVQTQPAPVVNQPQLAAAPQQSGIATSAPQSLLPASMTASTSGAVAGPPATTGPAGPQLASASSASPPSPFGATDSEPAPVRPTVTPVPTPMSTAPAPGFTSTAQPFSPPASVPAAAAPTPSAAPARSLVDILSALEVPDDERERNTAAANLTAAAQIQEERRKAEAAEKAKQDALAKAKAKAEADAKAKAEAERKKKLADNPSRNWVQLAAGRDTGALAFDLRRLRKSYAAVIGEEGAWTAAWGQTNRLLIGPYKSFDKAKEVEAALKKAGGDAFAWQSDAGEEVSKIGGK